MLRNALPLTVFAVVLSWSIVGCSRPVEQRTVAPGPAPGNLPQPVENAAPTPGNDAAGTIRVSGAFALYPMVITWAEEYRKTHPEVRIDVSAGGAGKGATDALGGLVEIGMISRAIHEDEEKQGGWWVPVVKDAVFPTMNAQNPVLNDILRKGVTRETFAGIWLTQEVRTWGAVVGTGNTDKIQVFTRSDACGAAETWAKFLDKEKKQEALKGTGVFGDPGLAEAVRKNRLAIGYNNLNFAYDTKTGTPLAGIRIVPLDRNGNGKLDPDEDFYATKDSVLKAIQDGRYPSPPARDLNFLCKGKPGGVTASFIAWCLTEGQALALGAGYIPLTPEQRQEALAKLK